MKTLPLTLSLFLPSLPQEAIFRVVASILHLGNIDFAKGKEVDSSVIKEEKAKLHLKTAAELLMYGRFLMSPCIFRSYVV